MELSKRQMTILGIVVFAIAFYFLFLKEEDEESGYSLFRKPPKKKRYTEILGNKPCWMDPTCINL